jgi:hypothetical protein
MEHLATLGYTTAEHLEAHVCADQNFGGSPTSPRINGHSGAESQVNGDLNRRDRFVKVLKVLIDHNYIVAVRDAHFQSLFDARQEIERKYRGLGLMPTNKTKKSQLDMDEKVSMELEQRLDLAISSASVLRELNTNNSDSLTVNTGQVLSSLRNQRPKLISTGEDFAMRGLLECRQVDTNQEAGV